jgi:hypothetical protein
MTMSLHGKSTSAIAQAHLQAAFVMIYQEAQLWATLHAMPLPSYNEERRPYTIQPYRSVVLPSRTTYTPATHLLNKKMGLMTELKSKNKLHALYSQAPSWLSTGS